MSLFICKGTKIKFQFIAERTTEHKLMRNLLFTEKLPIKLKNSESNKNMGFKKNINLYILWQRIFPFRGCL